MSGELNRAVLFNHASADHSRTSEGVNTVTVKITYQADDRFSETHSTHMSRDAAFELYAALKEVLCL